MKINTLLQEKTNFSPNESVIAGYILSHKDQVLQMSIQKLAKATYTSTSSVMRLCNRLNLKGYKEFKIQYAQELSHPDTVQEIDPNFPFSRDDSTGQIASQLEHLTCQSLQDAREALSLSDMQKACQLIHAAKRTAIFGIGDAYLAGLTFQARMMRAGISFLTTPVYGEQHHLSQTLNDDDCGLLLSYSGMTQSTIACAEVLKQNHVPTVCITASAKSTLAKACTVSLILPAKETKYHRIASFFSGAAMNYYLDVMYSCLYVMDYDFHSKKSID